MKRTESKRNFWAVALGALLLVSAAGAAPPVVESFGADGLTLEPAVSWERAVLVIVGPDGYRVTRTFEAGASIGFSGVDRQRGLLPDGAYNYELWLFAGTERRAVRRGSVALAGGEMTAGGHKSEKDGGPIERRDFTDPGDIMAGSGMNAGDTGANPASGEVEIEFGGATGSVERFTGGPDGVVIEAIDDALFLGKEFIWIGDDGNVGIGTGTPGQELHVIGGAQIQRVDGISPGLFFSTLNQDWRFQTNVNDGVFSIRDATNGLSQIRVYPAGQGSTLVVRNGRWGLRNSSPQHPIDAFNGARLTAAGVWANASSRESKQDVERLSVAEALAALEQLDPVKFAYKAAPEDPHVGFIAEDVPELVAMPGRETLSPMDLVAVLARVAQEQQRQIEELRELVRSRPRPIEVEP